MKTNKAKSWKVVLPDGKWCFVDAITRSEARAMAKKLFNIFPSLPAGTLCFQW